MTYELEYLPSAGLDILEPEAWLYQLNSSAADKFTDEIWRLTENLREYPFMYQVYEYDDYFRSMPLPYDYRLFYHVDERAETIRIHRVIHGMRDLSIVLNEQRLR
jgi:plasmid stabilization system protein ParE